MHERAALLRDLGTELHALIVASRAFTAQTVETFEPKVSGSAFAALQWMHAFGPAKASRIADGLAMDRSIVSRLMKQLGGLSLVEARADEEDGRAVVYGLTKIGRANVAAALAHKDNEYAKRLQAWPDADLVLLTGLLHRLVSRSEVGPLTPEE